jgi:hypothetical protein
MTTFPPKPDSDFPSIVDFKNGNLTKEWKDYFNGFWNSLGDDLKTTIATWDQSKKEANALYQLIKSAQSYAEIEEHLEKNPPSARLILHLLMIAEKHFKTESGSNAANARHTQAGGSLDKQKQIRQLWASGKYSSRTVCAQKEHEKLGMSLETARKALRNTPDPANRAARRKG